MSSRNGGGPQRFNPFGPVFVFVATPILFVVLGAAGSQIFAKTHALIISCGVLVLLLLAWILIVYYMNKSSYYYYFFFYRIIPVVLSAAALGVITYWLFAFFQNSANTIPLTTSRGGAFLICAFGFAIFTFLFAWTTLRLRMLSFQHELPDSQAKLEFEYLGHLPCPGNFPDKGNRVFRLDFKINKFVGYLRVSFIAIERLEVGTSKRTGIVWTSRQLRPARPLGLGESADGSSRIFNGAALDRLAASGDLTMFAFVFADDVADSRLFEPSGSFRAVAYFHQGGYVQGETTLPLDSILLEGMLGAPA